jgi:hypothetical protein
MTVFRLLGTALVAVACSAPAQAKTWRHVTAQETQQPLTIAGEGVTLTIVPPPEAADEAGDEELEAARDDLAITVAFPGTSPYTVPTDGYRSGAYGFSVGIGRMAPGDAAPTVLIAGFTGGAHCCATLQIVSLVDGQPVVAVLPTRDGGPLGRFPRDLDGDGTADLVWADDSLLYAFASHAGSWSVPRIYHLHRGEPVDVSREPGFVRIYRELAEQTLAICREDDGERNGACAAYAYARAMDGDAEGGIRTAASLAEASDWYPADCTVEPVDFECPEGKERQFAGFEDALRWIMRRNGYLP